MRVDPGTAFVPRSRPVDLSPGVTLDFSQPGNATYKLIESFNGKFRAEYLNAHLFPSLEDACRKCRQPGQAGSSSLLK
jgi:putative transposase